LPAIAAGSSSYLVCLLWERIRSNSAPSGMLAGFLAGLSFLMGGISSYYRHRLYTASLENNVIIMFAVAASTTYFWLLLRRYLPGYNGRRQS
jgi:Na+/proline symporter